MDISRRSFLGGAIAALSLSVPTEKAFASTAYKANYQGYVGEPPSNITIKRYDEEKALNNVIYTNVFMNEDMMKTIESVEVKHTFDYGNGVKNEDTVKKDGVSTTVNGWQKISCKKENYDNIVDKGYSSKARINLHNSKASWHVQSSGYAYGTSEYYKAYEDVKNRKAYRTDKPNDIIFDCMVKTTNKLNDPEVLNVYYPNIVITRHRNKTKAAGLMVTYSDIRTALPFQGINNLHGACMFKNGGDDGLEPIQQFLQRKCCALNPQNNDKTTYVTKDKITPYRMTETLASLGFKTINTKSSKTHADFYNKYIVKTKDNPPCSFIELTLNDFTSSTYIVGINQLTLSYEIMNKVGTSLVITNDRNFLIRRDGITLDCGGSEGVRKNTESKDENITYYDLIDNFKNSEGEPAHLQVLSCNANIKALTGSTSNQSIFNNNYIAKNANRINGLLQKYNYTKGGSLPCYQGRTPSNFIEIIFNSDTTPRDEETNLNLDNHVLAQSYHFIDNGTYSLNSIATQREGACIIPYEKCSKASFDCIETAAFDGFESGLADNQEQLKWMDCVVRVIVDIKIKTDKGEAISKERIDLSPLKRHNLYYTVIGQSGFKLDDPSELVSSIKCPINGKATIAHDAIKKYKLLGISNASLAPSIEGLRMTSDGRYVTDESVLVNDMYLAKAEGWNAPDNIFYISDKEIDGQTVTSLNLDAKKLNDYSILVDGKEVKPSLAESKLTHTKKKRGGEGTEFLQSVIYTDRITLEYTLKTPPPPPPKKPKVYVEEVNIIKLEGPQSYAAHVFMLDRPEEVTNVNAVVDSSSIYGFLYVGTRKTNQKSLGVRDSIPSEKDFPVKYGYVSINSSYVTYDGKPMTVRPKVIVDKLKDNEYKCKVIYEHVAKLSLAPTGSVKFYLDDKLVHEDNMPIGMKIEFDNARRIVDYQDNHIVKPKAWYTKDGKKVTDENIRTTQSLHEFYAKSAVSCDIIGAIDQDGRKFSLEGMNGVLTYSTVSLFPYGRERLMNRMDIKEFKAQVDGKEYILKPVFKVIENGSQFDMNDPNSPVFIQSDDVMSQVKEDRQFYLEFRSERIEKGPTESIRYR